MDCQTAFEYINMYVDNELDDKETEELLRHISLCESCRKELDDIVALKAALAGIKEVEPPAGLALSAIKKAKRRRIPVFTYASAAVAAAIVLVAVFSTGVLNNDRNMAPQKIYGVYTESADSAMEKAAAPREEPEVGMGAPMAPDECATLQSIEESGAGINVADASAYPIQVPPEYSESFRQKLDAFIVKYGIETEQTDNTVTFTVPEEYAAELKDMISESGIDFDAELTGGLRDGNNAGGLRVEIIFE